MKSIIKKIIYLYEHQQDGLHRISKFILKENINDYLTWFQELYPKGFGKEKDQYYLSASTIADRLVEWDVKLRLPLSIL